MVKKHLLDRRELADALENSGHPKDQRVLLTNNEQVFKTAPLVPRFQAAVLHRYEHPKRTALHKAFAKFVKNFAKPDSSADLNMAIPAELNSAGKMILVFPAQLQSEDYAILRKEFQAMAETFYAMTGKTKMTINVMSRLDTRGFHDHPSPFLNCNWLRKGSILINEQDVEYDVEEGDLLFIGPRFRHKSQPLTQDIGMTIFIGI